MTDIPYPVTIVMARYGGIYEPGSWLAFGTYPEGLPAGWDGDDASCSRFWSDNAHRAQVGAGDGPQSAYADLLRKLSGQEHD